MPGRTHVATLVRTWDSQMDEQSAGQPCTHMSLNKGDPNPAPTQIELALFHCSCCVLCFCYASATDCLLSTGSDKSVLALLCVIYFWPSCYLLLLSSSSPSSLCVQRFLSSTACQHKMDMYQLIFTACGGGGGDSPALVNSGSEQLLCALSSAFLCLSLSISISKFNVLATAHASRGNLFDGAACAVVPPPPPPIHGDLLPLCDDCH